MAASTVLKRNLGKVITLQFFRKTVPGSTKLCFCCPTPLTTVPLIRKRFYSGNNGKPGDIFNQESNVPEWKYESEIGYNQKAAEEEEEYEHSIKQRILNASLDHVLELGWTKQAIEAGARSEGLSEVAHGMFEKGGAEIIHHFYKKCNAQLVEYMKEEIEKLKTEGNDKPKTRPFIEDAIQTRLKMIIPYLSIWKEAMAIQTFPQNAPDSWKNVMNLSDDIWYYAGDRSTDFDWYTKRLSLAAIYKTTEIYMLQDSSPDYQETWIFLDNRMNDIQSLGSFTRSLGPIKEGILGLCEMGRNIIGMSSRNR